jgi:hypothetical protein
MSQVPADFAFQSALLFVWLLIGFALLATLGAIFEFVLQLYERSRTDDREVLPPPNPRTIVRRRGWNVPL